MFLDQGLQIVVRPKQNTGTDTWSCLRLALVWTNPEVCMEWLCRRAGPRATRVLATVRAAQSRSQWLWQWGLRWVCGLDGCSTLVASSFGKLDVFRIALLHDAPLPLSLLLRRDDHHRGKSRNLGDLSTHFTWLTHTRTHTSWTGDWFVVYLYCMHPATWCANANPANVGQPSAFWRADSQELKLQEETWNAVLPDSTLTFVVDSLKRLEPFDLQGHQLFTWSPFQQDGYKVANLSDAQTQKCFYICLRSELSWSSSNYGR